jgi:hypothetical protein
MNTDLRMFGNWVLSRIFGPKRDDVEGCWRVFHGEALDNLYPTSNIIRMIKSWIMWWARGVVSMGEMRNAFKIFVGMPEPERTLRRIRRR